MARRPRKCPEPIRGDELVAPVFRRAGLARKASEWHAMALWHRVAGPVGRKHSRAERLSRGSLIVRVESSAWLHQLGLLRAQLLTRLKAAPGGEEIRELRFTVGPLDELPAWQEPLREEQRPRGKPVHPPGSVDGGRPPPVDTGQVAAALLQIPDLELRRALAELFARAQSDGDHRDGRAPDGAG